MQSMHKLNDRHLNWPHPGAIFSERLKLAGLRWALTAVLLGSHLAPAKAGTEVRGHIDALQFRADNASTREALDALAAAFNLTYKLPPNINRSLNGLYSGSLRRVLARILDDTNFIIKNSDERIEVIVLRASETSGAATRAVSSIATPTNESTTTPSPGPAAQPIPPPTPILTPSDSSQPPPLASYLIGN